MENNHDNNYKGKPNTTTNPKKSDLISSAKVVADVVKSGLSKDTEKIDKGKVAGAAGNLLGAAKHYAKIEEDSNFGKYVGKAETYLHQYHSSHASSTSSASHGGSYGGGEGKHGGGYGEYVKLAQGFFNKKQDHGGEGGSSAQGFLKKH